MPDISNILQSTKIALEKQAADSFGAAVEDFARGSLGLGGTVLPASRIASRDPYTWYASSYAAALAGGTDFRPKLKFLFKVEFIFAPEAIAAYPQLKNNDFTFMIKTVDRPKVDFEYEDDVNQYNFRTKVLKKIRHRPLTMTFMDDTGNRVFDFFRTLMFLHSPITQRALQREVLDGRKPPTPLSVSEGNGMAFTSAVGLGHATQADIAHRGVINSNVGGSIACIRVKQMFINSTGRTSGDHLKVIDPQEVTYDFLNPRLESFDMDDLSHESSDPSLLTIQFDYDWMEMVKVGTLYEADTPTYNIAVPGITNAPTDILSGKAAPKEASATVKGASPAGAGNPFLGILVNQTARAAQKVTSDLINKQVKQVAGGGVFATAVAGGLAVVGASVNGVVSAGARGLLVSGGSSANGTFVTSTRPVASDSATLSTDNAKIVKSTNPGGV